MWITLKKTKWLLDIRLPNLRLVPILPFPFFLTHLIMEVFYILLGLEVFLVLFMAVSFFRKIKKSLWNKFGQILIRNIFVLFFGKKNCLLCPIFQYWRLFLIAWFSDVLLLQLIQLQPINSKSSYFWKNSPRNWNSTHSIRKTSSRQESSRIIFWQYISDMI